MIMKLELKHLAPYLPYGVKFQSSMDVPFDEYAKNPIWTIEGVTNLFSNYCLTTKENNDAYEIASCILLLHPLCDLTKEIEHNGNMFTFSDVYLSNSKVSKILGVERSTFDNFLNDIDYSSIQLLFKYHFDVFGLIEKGLAIDINTLNK